MSLTTLNPVPCRIPPAIGVDGSNSKASKVAIMSGQSLPPPQVKLKESLVLQKSFTPSRREVMQSLTAAASVGFLSLVLPAPAEARPRNATIRQKFLDKFEELRRKAGFPDGEKPKPKAKGEEEKAAGEITLPNVLNGKTVETTLP